MQTPDIQNIYKWGRIVLIVLAVFLGVATLGKLKSLKDPSPIYNAITVSGEGEAVGVPDVASFTFSVSADAATVSKAQEDVTKKMDAILASLKGLGIEEKDIKTSDYSVYPKYSYSQTPCSPTFCPPSRQTQNGYTANHSVSVKVRQTEKAGQALSAVGDAGATNLSSISFNMDDPNALVDEARGKAIDEAKQKAKTLAKDLGVKLVRVMGYSDNMGGAPMPYFREGATNGMAMDAVQAKAPTLPTGENKVNVNVSITYEIR